MNISADSIAEIGIDDTGRLYIKPEKQAFSQIYRTATEVHWDTKEKFLYSPKPREWSYYQWYKYIIDVVNNECGCLLILTDKTEWTNIPYDLKIQIEKTSGYTSVHSQS